MTAAMIAGQQFTEADAASRRKLIQELAGYNNIPQEER